MLITALFILDKIIIGLSGAALSGLFALGAKYLFTNPVEEATDAMIERVRREEKERE